MKPDPHTFQVSSDIIEKLLLKGVIPSFQLPFDAKIDSSLLAFVFATKAQEAKNEGIELKPFAECIQKVKEFISATDAYIYYADYEEDYGDYYIGATDTIHLSYPVEFFEPDDMPRIVNYYRVLFHELGHWTGNPFRLNRQYSRIIGSPGCAEEELTAELTAAFTLSKLNITEDAIIDRPAYLAKWEPIIDILNDNKISIANAVLKANEACDYLFSFNSAKLE